MLTPKIKLYATTSVIALAILPRLIFFTANCYISGYQSASTYIDVTTTKILGSIGLERTQEEQNRAQFIAEASNKYKLHQGLLMALMREESAHNPDAFSPKEAIGLMQIMPANAKRCGLSAISKLWDEKTNINCGSLILSQELATYKGNLRSALESFNGGPKAVNHFPESQRYAQRIIENFAQSLTKYQ